MLSLAEQPIDLVRQQAFVVEPTRSIAGPLEELPVAAEPNEAEI